MCIRDRAKSSTLPKMHAFVTKKHYAINIAENLPRRCHEESVSKDSMVFGQESRPATKSQNSQEPINSAHQAAVTLAHQPKTRKLSNNIGEHAHNASHHARRLASVTCQNGS